MNLIDILIRESWNSHRKIYNKELKQFSYEEVPFKNVYSTLNTGELDYRFMKNGKEVIWGLNQRGKPATLHWPTKFIQSEHSVPTDDEKLRYIKDTNPEEVYKQILNYYDNN